jgi:hypothetical protein
LDFAGVPFCTVLTPFHQDPTTTTIVLEIMNARLIIAPLVLNGALRLHETFGNRVRVPTRIRCQSESQRKDHQRKPRDLPTSLRKRWLFTPLYPEVPLPRTT